MFIKCNVFQDLNETVEIKDSQDNVVESTVVRSELIMFFKMSASNIEDLV